MTGAEERRHALARTLSELWLDTEPESERIGEFSTAIRDSGLSASDVDALVVVELAPILDANLRSVAGDWTGFDPEWLREALRARRASLGPAKRLLARLRFRFSPVRTDWERLRERAFPRP